MKICHFCGNKNFNKKNIQYTYKHNDKFFIVNDVPCEECEYCGEQYFKAGVLKAIEKEFNQIYSSGKRPTAEIKVPIENFLIITDLGEGTTT